MGWRWQGRDQEGKAEEEDWQGESERARQRKEGGKWEVERAKEGRWQEEIKGARKTK